MAKKAAKKAAKKTGRREAKKVAPRERANPGAGTRKPLNPRNPNIVKVASTPTVEPVVLTKKETELKIEEATHNSNNLPWFTNAPDRSNISVNEE